MKGVGHLFFFFQKRGLSLCLYFFFLFLLVGISHEFFVFFLKKVFCCVCGVDVFRKGWGRDVFGVGIFCVANALVNSLPSFICV